MIYILNIIYQILFVSLLKLKYMKTFMGSPNPSEKRGANIGIFIGIFVLLFGKLYLWNATVAVLFILIGILSHVTRRQEEMGSYKVVNIIRKLFFLPPRKGNNE